MQGKVAVIGDADFVMPFAAIGADTFAVGDAPGSTVETAAKVFKENYALVVVAENIAPAVQDVLADYANAPTPAVVVVPFTTESKGFATESLAETLKMATGINIMQED